LIKPNTQALGFYDLSTGLLMLEICSGLSTRDEHRESWVESPEQISAIFTLPSPIKIDTGI